METHRCRRHPRRQSRFEHASNTGHVPRRGHQFCAQKLWAGTVTIHANAKTGAHHHGHLESIIYILKGMARMRWGEKLEFVAEAGPGDFIYVPPWVPHQEINASEDQELECVLVRSDGEAIAVNSPDVKPVEKPENVRWVDPTHANLHGHEHTHEH